LRAGNKEKKKQQLNKIDIAKCRLAVIYWMDAQDGETGWTPIADIKKHGLATVYDVGWIVHEDDKKIVVMGSVCWEGKGLKEIDGGRYMAIPKSWVNKIWYLDRNKEYGKIRIQFMGRNEASKKRSKGVSKPS
jgi:hypothetical protein